MKKIDAVVVFIEDVLANIEAICDDIEDSVLDIKQFTQPEDGVSFIRDNLDKKIIVVLDWSFASGKIVGHIILKQIHDLSSLIPVIIFTGQDLDVTATTQMYDGQAFYCLSKDMSTHEVIEIIEKAYGAICNNINAVIERWIVNQPDTQKSIPYVRIGGKEYTMNDVLSEIRRNTEIGKDVSRGVLSMTTDLFFKQHKTKL
ncbi:MAG: hypothetical protein MJZ84_02220 [Paludibacteraceae bacterium]|nr:hypothetical protein [Paludibacteraceae bacterium]